MVTEAMRDGPARLTYPDYGNGIVEKFSDLCGNCTHTRADHLNTRSVDIAAISDCNRCGKFNPKHATKANMPKCGRYS